MTLLTLLAPAVLLQLLFVFTARVLAATSTTCCSLSMMRAATIRSRLVLSDRVIVAWWWFLVLVIGLRVGSGGSALPLRFLVALVA
jgi:hypothetical protein